MTKQSDTLLNRIQLLEHENDALRRDKQALTDVMEKWSENESISRPNAHHGGTGARQPPACSTHRLKIDPLSQGGISLVPSLRVWF